MVQYSEHKDENQIRNLALMVANPTGVRVPKTPNPKGTGFFSFIEMETQEKAKELLELVSKKVDGYKAFWAREPCLNSEWGREGSRIINDWGDKTKAGFKLLMFFCYLYSERFENLNQDDHDNYLAVF